MSHKYVVIVWRPPAKTQPQARRVKVSSDGAVNGLSTKTMTNVPNDETMKGGTGISSSKAV